jgi:hypothetical protein
VVKLGGEGAVLCTRSQEVAFRAKALQVDVTDTVGCGDSFAAAVVLGYIRDHDIPPTMVGGPLLGPPLLLGLLPAWQQRPGPPAQRAWAPALDPALGSSSCAALAVPHALGRPQPVCSEPSKRLLQVLANAVGAATAMGRGAGRNVARPGLVMDLLAQHAAEANGSGADVRTAIDMLRLSLDQGDSLCGAGADSEAESVGSC